ncbi:SpaH/EbpB family LPXTG-anchored major pilin [Enterococcus sp. 669A]|uniref:SpaH/EbpB family LPXTG-anchored major pilin n=1 Tax=Candidatus Enterococcus moelleringii TaxID=2815325 RepID=A0ABS3LCJ6_9ENTE|nr:SpaH/EbpB family LPXTG-anchored major pilin [Enterococcus sp. 669A]MBO1306124.1 SpaH/EbpB family LPXTG-anchored major pilin [Enterococcus sp. 669A]
MKKKSKWISRVAVSLGLLTMLGGVGLGAGTSVLAAPPTQNITQNPVSDTTSKRSITIWKYEINSASELGGRGDGESLDPAQAPDLQGKKVMQDVNFEIIRVIPAAGKKLTNPLVQTVANGDYTIDSSFTKQTGKTAADGSLTFDVGTGKAGDGIYLVTEIPDANGDYTYSDPSTNPLETGLKINKPMDPFFVWLPQTKRDDTSKLIYDVHVHPKNIVTDTELDKTVEGGKGFSIKAGEKFQWEATTKLPSGLYFKADKPMIITGMVDPVTHLPAPDKVVAVGDEVYGSYFRVNDDLNTDLLLDDVEVRVLGKDGITWTTLTNGTEYTAELNGTVVTAGNAVTNTTKGDPKKVVISLTEPGMKKLTEDENTHIQVIYKVRVEQNFNGVITNKYDVAYLIPGQEPVTENSDEPEYYDGGFKIKKLAEDKTTELAGAEFYIAETEADARAKKFLASDGKAYTLNDDGTSTPVLPAGVTYLTSTTNATGDAQFDGLQLNWFTDSNNNGKQEPSIPSEATWPRADIEKDYWIVETKSPTGYELIKEPVKVTVKLDTHTSLTVEVENKAKTDLPFTGGTGTMLLVSIALGAITIGTVAIAIDKKRRAA